MSEAGRAWRSVGPVWRMHVLDVLRARRYKVRRCGLIRAEVEVMALGAAIAVLEEAAGEESGT